MVDLDTLLRSLLGTKAKQLESALGLRTVGDLLGYYPRRLDDRGRLTDFSNLPLGEHVTVLARTVSVHNHQYTPKQGRGRRPAIRTEVVVTDGTRQLLLTFFRQPWRKGELEPGTVGMFSGKVGEFRGRRQLTQPTFDVLGRGSDLDDLDDFAGTLTADESQRRFWPIYPATSHITSKKILDSIDFVLAVVDDIPDTLSEHERAARGLMPLDQAYRKIHQPTEQAEWDEACERLRFEEAFAFQTVLAKRRQAVALLPAIPRPRRSGALLDRFDAQLPFTLTAGQTEVGLEIQHDLARDHPMHRLLQGEVGSGKTIVALRAMLQVVDAGGQAALLAPTEVLAAQHHRSITALLGSMADAGMLGSDDDATRVTLLTGSLNAKRRRSALSEAMSGAAGIVIGTHALLEDAVAFAELGLVVVDEQHRFGVEQRAALTTKAEHPPHVLVMTATPIPRTVAMTAFGDLDTSTLAELPAGRRPIQTTVVPTFEKPAWLERVWARVHEEVDKGLQAYVVAPRIGDDTAPDRDPDKGAPPTDVDTVFLTLVADLEEDNRRPPLAVLEVADSLSSGPLADVRVEVLHGRMTGDAKDDVMRRFASGEIDVLVATTVIEVGVDVANASVMVILDAERFGVSQLHQLRGRVGRGEVDGLCLLVTDSWALSKSRERLEGVAETADGFELAQLDLRTRREGDILGAAQSGTRSSLRLLSVLRDGDVIADARELAAAIVDADPSLDQHRALAAVIQRLEASEQSEYLDKS